MTYLLVRLLTLTVCLANAIEDRYDNYHMFQIIPQTKEHLNFLHNLQNIRNIFTFWNEVTSLNNPVNIMVPPHKIEDFNLTMSFNNITKIKLKIKNVQLIIDKEQSNNKDSSSSFNWKKYHTLEDIYAWLKSLENQYPEKVKVIKGGQTSQGREILGVKISFKPSNKGVFIEGGIHAREWISPATITYIANELLVSKDSFVQEVAESRDWYIFPVINPDGYVFTHTSNRFWKKSRKHNGVCDGIDLNRNWGYHWNDGGASLEPCSEVYNGPSAFSEIEVKSLSDYITTIAPTLDAYLSFHSNAKTILIPFGHAGLEVPANNKELHTIGKRAARALAKRYGTKYTVGNVPDILNVASGGSVDWAMGNFRNIRIGYTYKLKSNHDGFELPPKEIISTGKETFDSVISIFGPSEQPQHRDDPQTHPCCTLPHGYVFQRY